MPGLRIQIWPQESSKERESTSFAGYFVLAIMSKESTSNGPFWVSFNPFGLPQGAKIRLCFDHHTQQELSSPLEPPKPLRLLHFLRPSLDHNIYGNSSVYVMLDKNSLEGCTAMPQVLLIRANTWDGNLLLLANCLCLGIKTYNDIIEGIRHSRWKIFFPQLFRQRKPFVICIIQHIIQQNNLLQSNKSHLLKSLVIVAQKTIIETM